MRRLVDRLILSSPVCKDDSIKFPVMKPRRVVPELTGKGFCVKLMMVYLRHLELEIKILK